MCDSCDMAREHNYITPTSLISAPFQKERYIPEILGLFDAAVKSYTDGTTTDFRILVQLYFDPLREHLVKVLEGSP